MLIAVDRDWSSFDDAGAYSVGSLSRLRPHATQPGPPVAERVRQPIISAMFDRDAVGVTEENGVSGASNQFVETVDLLLSIAYERFHELAPVQDFAGRKHAWCTSGSRIHAM